jgi:putative endonuclease
VRRAATLFAEVVRMAHNAELGRRGEQLAVDHLEARGMRVIERNWRCRLGEIDLVARDGDDTVFVEVKTRTTADYGHPFESITPVKLARLRRLAVAWCEATDAATARIRIDAVAVLAPTQAPALIEHLEGIG